MHRVININVILKKILLMAITFIFVTCVFVSIHEMTHASIAENMGCYNISYHFWEDDAFASVHYYCKGSEDYHMHVNQLQALNDIIGYNVMSVLVVILVILVIRRD